MPHYITDEGYGIFAIRRSADDGITIQSRNLAFVLLRFRKLHECELPIKYAIESHLKRIGKWQKYLDWLEERSKLKQEPKPKPNQLNLIPNSYGRRAEKLKALVKGTQFEITIGKPIEPCMCVSSSGL